MKGERQTDAFVVISMLSEHATTKGATQTCIFQVREPCRALEASACSAPDTFHPVALPCWQRTRFLPSRSTSRRSTPLPGLRHSPPTLATPSSSSSVSTNTRTPCSACLPQKCTWLRCRLQCEPCAINDQTSNPPLTCPFPPSKGYLRDTLEQLQSFINPSSCPSRTKPGYAPLFHDFQYFYTRRMYWRIQDCFNRPITSAPGAWIDVMNREKSKDHSSMTVTEGEIRAAVCDAQWRDKSRRTREADVGESVSRL